VPANCRLPTDLAEAAPDDHEAPVGQRHQMWGLLVGVLTEYERRVHLNGGTERDNASVRRRSGQQQGTERQQHHGS
jgi:hypothetical protein